MGQKVFIEIPLKKEVLFNLDILVVDPTTGNPIEGAMVTLTNDCEGAEPEAVYTDSTGILSFELAEECCYTITATKEGYFGSPVENQCTRDLTEPTTLQAVVNLSPIVAPEITDEPIVDNNLTPDGYTTDPETGQLIDKFGEPADGEIGQDTYEDGIRQPREDEFTVVRDETQEGEPIAYLLHIYYDFDQSYLRDEAQPEIEKLCKMLTANSDLIIEIASHTDSRGSFRYNRSLSQRRAESVVRALVECGIAEGRLVARGYGENKNINNCANRIPCSEREHQMNRRTEFRIIGCTSCSDVKAISKKNEDAKVDECASCPF